MTFKDLHIKSEYRSLTDNVVKDFYIPLLNQAVLYKRAVGFFSSSSLIEISKGISGLVKNGGTIELVASPHLSEEDIDAINSGYEMRNQIIEKSLLDALGDHESNQEQERLNLLAHLIAEDRLNIKIAFTMNNRKLGMYHEKMGLIYDNDDNIIAFSGSMNETSYAMKLNYEAIDVYTSWGDESDKSRVSLKEIAFNNIWNNIEENVEILEFPNIKKEILEKYKKKGINYDIDMKETTTSNDFVMEQSIEMILHNTPKIPDGFNFHDYQKRAIENWVEQEFKGIFDMATGTGKTYTALGAITKLNNYLNNNLAVIIVCPYQHLVEQWVEDLELFNIDPLIGYSGSKHKNFKKMLNEKVIDYNLNVTNFFCFICTNATFGQQKIQQTLNKLDRNVLLVVDEAHNFGSTRISKTLTENYKFRIALSATLERHNDEEGSILLNKYFGKKCIEYSLEKAITEKKLTEYYYYPIPINFTDEELELYYEISKEMSRCLIKGRNGKLKLNSYGEMLALKRARLVAGASEKVNALKGIMNQYKNDSHMLVYCGATKYIDQNDDDYQDIRQIDHITQILGNELNMKVHQFTSKEDSQLRSLLKQEFELGENLQALIAIKCLDEGVNIPKIKIAFILASTTNPKEYIQRRGRVLRLSPGKEHAIIYDFITLPRPLDELHGLTIEEKSKDISLIKKELSRIMEFKRISKNPYDSDQLINKINETYDLYETDEEIMWGV